MKTTHNRFLFSALAGAILLTSAVGCGSLSRTEKGAIIGAGAGTVVGGAIGRATGNTARGAIIGAAVGGTAGAVIGRQMDRQAAELEEEIANGDVQRVGEGIQITFNNAILFDFGKSDLKGTARTDLADLAQSLQRYPNTDVQVYGHTDSVGSDDFNQGLSERRAEAAASYLVSQGISRSRITTIGRGERSPIASNATEAGQAQNRRVEIAIVASEEFQRQAATQNGGR